IYMLGRPLLERRELLKKLITPDKRSPIQFSDDIEGDGARFFKAAVDLGLEGIVSKRAASRYRSGPSRSWLKTKNMVEGDFILIGTDRDRSGVVRAFQASEENGALRFAGAALLVWPEQGRAELAERIPCLGIRKAHIAGVAFKARQWLRPELRVRVGHLKVKGTLRHASVKQLLAY